MASGGEHSKDAIEKAVLAFFVANATKTLHSEQFAREHKFDTQLLDGVLRSLASSSFVVLVTTSNVAWGLTDEGKDYEQHGAPEAQVWAAVAVPLPVEALNKQLGKTAQVGMSQATKRGWVVMDKSQKPPMVKRAATTIVDDTKAILTRVAAGTENDEKTLNDLKTRKLVTRNTFSTHAVTKGPKFAAERKKPVTDLTAELLQSGEYETADFKEYNFAAKGQEPTPGCLHPLLKVRAEFRSILLEMGFSEMPTNNFVESSFWNFDTLCVAQQHAARDLHDTFFIKSPAECVRVPEAYKDAVQTMHEKGGHGSIGFRYDWKIAEAKKNILRTHTTAVSARMLKALADQKQFEPKKYFSIDRVFRNESLDATHLAEFHQVEGLIADYHLTLGDLIGTMQTFFKRWGIDELKFKPAYNPYTEPSMEIFAWLKDQKRWVEIGNSGVFRPEMLAPMGLPDDVRVIAWGLSLERPTMIKYGYKSIRQLFGHKVKLNLIQQHPICRFE